MRNILIILMTLMIATSAHGALQTGNVIYSYNGADFVGYMAWDDGFAGKRPGVLVVHEWWGLNDYARMRVDQLAQMGYVAFAVDMYGGGKVTADPAEAARWAKEVRGTPLMRERALAGLQVLAAHERVNSRQVAAIGFCFGGTAVMEMAYAGADVAGVVSFHGGLTVPTDEDMTRIKTRIQIFHGADDRFVKPETISAMEERLDAAGVDWQMATFAHAVHAFTNPAAGDDPSKGVAYNEKAAERSWKYMQVFFEEIFSEREW